jgi:hypothetical protein
MMRQLPTWEWREENTFEASSSGFLKKMKPSNVPHPCVGNFDGPNSVEYSSNGMEILAGYQGNEVYLFRSVGEETGEMKWFSGHRNRNGGMLLLAV